MGKYICSHIHETKEYSLLKQTHLPKAAEGSGRLVTLVQLEYLVGVILMFAMIHVSGYEAFQSL